MPRYGTACPSESRRQMVELVRSGRTLEKLAREFEPTAQSISTWVKPDGQRTANAATIMRHMAPKPAAAPGNDSSGKKSDAPPKQRAKPPGRRGRIQPEGF